MTTPNTNQPDQPERTHRTRSRLWPRGDKIGEWTDEDEAAANYAAAVVSRKPEWLPLLTPEQQERVKAEWAKEEAEGRVIRVELNIETLRKVVDDYRNAG